MQKLMNLLTKFSAKHVFKKSKKQASTTENFQITLKKLWVFLVKTKEAVSEIAVLQIVFIMLESDS